MEIFMKLIYIVFCCFLFFGSPEAKETTTDPEPENPEQKPELEPLTLEEWAVIINNRFLNAMLIAFSAANSTVKPIVPIIKEQIEDLVKTDKEFRDKLNSNVQRRNMEQLTFYSSQNPTELTVPTEPPEPEPPTGPEIFAQLFDSRTADEIFNGALLKLQNFLQSLAEDKPKIEFLAYNLNFIVAMIESGKRPSEKEETLPENDGESNTEDYIEVLYKKKSNLTTMLMGNINKLVENCEIIYGKIQTLLLEYDGFKQYANVSIFDPDMPDEKRLNITVVRKFNWTKRYEIVEKSIEPLETLEFFKVHEEAYSTDTLLVVKAAAASLSTKENFRYQHMRKKGKRPMNKSGKNAAPAAKNATKGQKRNSKSGTLQPPLVKPFKKLVKKTSSKVHAVVKELSKKKANSLNVRKILNEIIDSILSDKDNYSKLNDEEKEDPDKENYCKTEEERKVKYESSCLYRYTC